MPKDCKHSNVVIIYIGDTPAEIMFRCDDCGAVIDQEGEIVTVIPLEEIPY